MREHFTRESALIEIGGAGYLLTLVQNAAKLISHAQEYAELIIDLAARREALQRAEEIREAAESGGDLAQAMRAADVGMRAFDKRGLTLEWAADTAPRAGEWLVKGILPNEGLAVMYGPPGSGKSFLAIDKAMTIATGGTVLGAKTRRVGVAFVAAEAADGVRKRVLAWRLAHAHTEDVPLAVIDAAPDLSDPNSPDVDRLIATLNGARREFEARGCTAAWPHRLGHGLASDPEH